MKCANISHSVGQRRCMFWFLLVVYVLYIAMFAIDIVFVMLRLAR